MNHFGQVYTHPQGIAYYKEGTGFLEKGEYREAEKSITVALNTLKDENVYMKRAIARLNQSDTAGFCADMNMAANKYFDLQASLLFNKLCCKSVDTLFFNKKFQPASKSNFRYYEEIKQPRYEAETVGIIHDLKVKKASFNIEYGRDQSNLAKNYEMEASTVNNQNKTTDIIAVYLQSDTMQYYYIATKPVTVMNLTKYNIVKNSMKKMLKSQFYQLKIENKLDITIYFELFINTKGEITDVKVLGTYPGTDIRAVESALNEEISKLVKEYPPLKPALFNGKSVDFVALDFVTY
jgi:hypothetical protein